MPRFELRQNNDDFDPLSSFKVLAVMCHPQDRVRREALLARLQKETASGNPRRKGISSDEFFAEVKFASSRAAVAGGLLLTLLQLQLAGHRPSVNQAVPLVTALLPKWENQMGPLWSKGGHVGHRPRSRSGMLNAFQRYRSVSHLWAALILGGQLDRLDIGLGSLKTLPTFLAYANCVLEMACTLLPTKRDRRAVMSRANAWTFTIPNRFHQAVRLEGLPLNDEQIGIINEQRTRSTLI